MGTSEEDGNTTIREELWSGWVSLSTEKLNNRWRRRYLNLTNEGIECYDSEPHPSHGTAKLRENSSSSLQSDNAMAMLNLSINTVDESILLAQNMSLFEPERPETTKRRSSAASESDATELSTSAAASAIRSKFFIAQEELRLEHIIGYLLLGSDESFLKTETELDYGPEMCVKVCSLSHHELNKGKLTLYLLAMNERDTSSLQASSMKLWRIRFDDIQCLDLFLLLTERAMPRLLVYKCSWIYSAGTLNWNKRFAVILSSGNLLIFRDSSLEDLRRNILLSADSNVELIKSKTEFETQFPFNKGSSGLSQGIRISGPCISEKKGYLFGLDDKFNDGKPQELDEWIRVLKFASDKFIHSLRETSSVVGAQESRLRQLQIRRNSNESRIALLRVLNYDKMISGRKNFKDVDEKFLRSPALLALLKAGIPLDLRSSLWSLLLQTRRRRTSKIRSFQMTEMVEGSIETISFHSYQNAQHVTRLVKRLALENPYIGVSEELFSLASCISAVFDYSHTANSEDNAERFEVLNSFLFNVCPSYHLNSASTKPILVNSDLKLSDCSLQLHVDVMVMYEILIQVFPRSQIHRVSTVKIHELLMKWLLGAFSKEVPFSFDVTMRIWDLFIVEMSKKRYETSDSLIRLGLAIIAALEPLLESVCHKTDTKNVEEQIWSILRNNDKLLDSNDFADVIIDYAFADERITRFASKSAIHERRTFLWRKIESEAFSEIQDAEDWLSAINKFGEISSQVIQLLNSRDPEIQNLLVLSHKYETLRIKGSRCMKSIMEALHLIATNLQEQVTFLRRNFYYVKSFLEMFESHNSSKDSEIATMTPNDYSIEELNAELNGRYNLKVIRGPQILINPNLLLVFGYVLVEIGWKFCSVFWKCFHLNETLAYHTLKREVKVIPIRHEQSVKHQKDTYKIFLGNSLQALVKVLSPLGEHMSETPLMNLGSILQKEIFLIMKGFVQGLRMIEKRITNMSEGQHQQPDSLTEQRSKPQTTYFLERGLFAKESVDFKRILELIGACKKDLNDIVHPHTNSTKQH